MLTRTLTVLGATGTVGEQTLRVVAANPELSLHGISFATNWRRAAEISLLLQPRYVASHDSVALHAARTAVADANPALARRMDWLAGGAQVAALAAQPVDLVVAAIVGAAGLPAVAAAVQAGQRVLIANKEPLVMAGDILIERAQQTGAVLVPLDSEHNALLQCMTPATGAQLRAPASVVPRGIVGATLTASGGPFLDTAPSALAAVTVAQAVAHPVWRMGAKISVDSATMMNKALEIIEACMLFGLAPEQLEVIIHPQGIVHAMLQYRDGACVALLAHPDMRVPIAHAMAGDDRLISGVDAVNLVRLGTLAFREVPPHLQPAITLARQIMATAKGLEIVFSVANEVAVQAFLKGALGFDEIVPTVRHVVENWRSTIAHDIDGVLCVDEQVRAETKRRIEVC